MSREPESRSDGLILYGPPGAGKSTLAAQLEAQGQFRRYRLLRSGPASPSYRPFSPGQPTIWESEKYGRSYGIDTAGFDEIPSHAIALVELGEPAAVASLQQLAIRWITVYLWCDRSEAKRRFASRGNSDSVARLAAWDNTPSIEADLAINTADISVQQALQMIEAIATPR